MTCKTKAEAVNYMKTLLINYCYQIYLGRQKKCELKGPCNLKLCSE